MNTYHSLDKRLCLTGIFIFAMLHGCGVAHVRTDMESTDLHEYGSVFISTVRVYSEEAAATENEELQAKMKEWAVFARGELEEYVNDSHYQLLGQPPASTDKALILALDTKIIYGSRALRYWVGFGAGKGRVDSVLIVTDHQTGDDKFRAVANSDMSVGAFGGNMEKVLEENIAALIDQYPRAPDED